MNNDKILHFAVCLVLAAAITIIRGWLPAFLIVMLIGLAKEIYDEAHYQGFDWKDLVADAAGTLSGIALGWLMGLT